MNSNKPSNVKPGDASVFDNSKTINADNFVQSVELFDESSLKIRRHYSRFQLPFTCRPPIGDYDSSLFMSLINDKLYQLFNEKQDYVEVCHQRALAIIRLGTRQLDGQDAAIHEVWEGLMNSLRHIIKRFIQYSKELPGFSNIAHRDFFRMANKRIYGYMLLKKSLLFINGEYYWRMPNGIHYSKGMMVKIIGSEVTEKLFSFEDELSRLQLTRKELALTIPIVLSQPGLRMRHFFARFCLIALLKRKP